jgi:inorganic triphosphatase YgiF
MSPRREIELKLEVPAYSLARLTRSSLLKGASTAGEKPATQVSVYFDTDKLKLRKKGVSLRVRRIGRRYVQTVKQETGESETLLDRNEWEYPVRSKQPDFDAARDTALGPLLNKKLRRSLKPVFETRVQRSVYPIQRGDSEIELIIDQGKIEAGQESAPLCEVELELKRGTSAELFKLARALADQVPVQLAVTSKAERGYALAAAEQPKPIKAAPVALTPDLTRQAAFHAVARACVHQLVGNVPAMRRGDPEGLHQMRVALRRLRAAVSLFADMLLDPQTEERKAEFKWIMGELGPARELDVFIKGVVKPAADGKPNSAGVMVLTRELQEKREEALSRAVAAIESARFRALVLDTAAWIETGDWTRTVNGLAQALREQPISVTAVAQLKKRWKKILKNGARLDELDPQRRHRLRIQAKKLRYASEFFAGVFPGKKAARRQQDFLAGLEKLQDALGELNDIAVHENLTERIADAPDGKRRAGRTRKAFAAGRLSGREEARIASVLKDARRAYDAFAEAKPFWSNRRSKT